MQTSNSEPKIINDRYRLDRQLGEGGMAEVHIGKDLLLDRDVAVKILHSKFAEDQNFITRFNREAQAAANLSHPNIVAIHDVGQFEKRNFIVMEYIEGQTLADYINDGRTRNVDEAVRIAIDVAQGLDVAHKQGTIHRDIKPCNILMASNGTPKIADFGIARALDTTNTALTQTGFVVGTPMYFSPEQSRGDQVDTRSDLYSLGIVLYEMLNGSAPFTGDSSVSLGVKHATEQPPKANSKNDAVPPGLVAVVDKLLAKQPADRYENAGALIDALKSISSVSHNVENDTPSNANPGRVKSAPPAPPGPLQPPVTQQQTPIPQAPTVISGQHQANIVQPATAATPPPQGNFQPPGGNFAPQAAMNYPQNQMPSQQATNQYQPPSTNNTSKILLIVAAALVGVLAIGSVGYFILNGGDEESTKSASDDDTSNDDSDESNDDEDKTDEKKDNDDEDRDVPDETTKATSKEKSDSGVGIVGGVPLEEATAQLQSTIGVTDDISETVTSVTEFPEFATPGNSQIVGLSVRHRSEVNYGTDEPQFVARKKVTFITDETDIEELSTLLQDSITDWGEPEISETSKVTDGTTTEIRKISYPTDSYDINLDIELNVTDNQPAIVSIEHRDEISGADEMSQVAAKYAGWSSNIPFPEDGELDSFALIAGQSSFINLDASYAKNVDAEVGFRYEGEIEEDALEEKIVSAVEASDLSINESRGSGGIVYVYGDSIDDERSTFSGFAGSEYHTVNFRTTVK